MLHFIRRLKSEISSSGWYIKYALYRCSHCKRNVKKILAKRERDSCGCNLNNLRAINATKHSEGQRNNRSRLYGIWSNMRNRCNNPKLPEYKYYGGKGVKVCSEWDNYLKFKKWSLKNGYKKDLTIDRVNSDKGYYPENCCWTTRRKNSIKAGLITASKTMKLNFKKATKIRELYKSGFYSQDKLSEIYNVSQETIWRIVKNISYTNPIIVNSVSLE